MKINFRIAVLIALFVTLFLPGTALAGGTSSSLPDEYVFGDNYTLESGETLAEDLYVFGGNVNIESGATLNGDIWLTGGNLTIDGEVGGNVHATGGSIRLGDSAVVGGDIEMTGASLDRDPSALVGGDIDYNSTGPLELAPGEWSVPTLATLTGSIFTEVFSVFLWSFLMAALAVIVVIFWPKQIALTGTTAIEQPLISGAWGLAAVAILIVLAITIILSPISALGFLLLGLLSLFGWIALGYEVGYRLMRAFKVEWALPVSAALGTLLLTFVASSISAVLDCLGWPITFVVGMIGVGAVLITRLGTQPYPPASAAPLTVRQVKPPAVIVTPEIPPEPEMGAETHTPGGEVKPPEEEIPPAS